MNTQKSVLNKISNIKKEELSAEKVELARKPQSILGDLKKLDSKMASEESKMSKVYQNYRQAQKDFVSFMRDAAATAESLDNDISSVMDAAQEIGITDYKSIDGLAEAFDLYLRLKDIAKNAQKLYPSVG